ncbi:MAG: dCTP deaminase [Candidatus Micrarchaeota archaeon]|nr:dCTP deaminase [Candidatus Micrarchaeota archaeon]
MLSHSDILRHINTGDIIIDPLEPQNIGPDSIDIRLGSKLLVARKTGKIIDPRKDIEMEFDQHDISSGPYAIKPGDFVLATTIERIGLSNNITGQLEGRSSVGRLGIVVHMTAGLIHAGWGYRQPATLTLELSSVNPNPVYLYEGMKIAQMSFVKLTNPAEIGYDDNVHSKYSNQQGPLPSRINRDHTARK